MATENELQNMNATGQAVDAAALPGQTQAVEEGPKEQIDFQEKYERLGVRYKHLLEERDALSRQVSELRRQLEEAGACKHDTVEEIKLLNKLLDEERALYDEAREKGALPAAFNALTRHDKFVGAFFNIITRT